MTISLSSKQKQYLKGLAHPLKPVIMVGGNGLTEGVMAELELALEHHELIKVKIASEDRDERKAVAATIEQHADAMIVQTIGKTLVLYRPSEEQKISLPRK